MANKHGGLLATLGKRMLGFSVGSSGCCTASAPAGEAEQAPALEAKGSDAEVGGVRSHDATTKDAGGCAPSCCAPAAPVGSDAKPSA